MQPAVSIIITSDYAFDSPRSRDMLGACLAALSRQDSDEPAEFILVESAEIPPQVIAESSRILPSLKIVTAPAPTAAELKNAGVRAASAELVAFIDGDCVADSGWLRHFLAVMREHRDIAVVTGRTHYGTGTFL